MSCLAAAIRHPAHVAERTTLGISSKRVASVRASRPDMTSINRCLVPQLEPLDLSGRGFRQSLDDSIQRGYFHTPIFCLTCSFSASCRPSVFASARSTTKAFGFSSPSGSASGTTAASSTAGWVISALSTSNGDTQMPETLNMSSLRPQKV